MNTRKQRTLEELQWLQQWLPGDITYQNGIQVLRVKENLGEGEVRCVCFDEGLMAMEFDIVLNENRDIKMDRSVGGLIYFLYCFTGNCFHKFEGIERLSKLEELQTAVVSNMQETASTLRIVKGERLVLNLIQLNKDMYQQNFDSKDDRSYGKTIAMLDTFDENPGFFQLGRINLEIAELIKLLENAKYVNELSTLMQFEGICHLILAKQIEQFNIDLLYGSEPTSGLSKNSLKMITEIGDFVKNYPEIQHSVDSLCRKSGLSAAKMQKGFKYIYHMTVGEFIRDCRLVKGEHLIRTTDMNVSEVVYAIGFTSRSYFCKIFKAKYRCSPKAYKNMVFNERYSVKA